ncbi:MAG: anaerobic ribonucleoside-triphosphate reductase activating protein [Candidatus Lokiarchaeota archaeon]|nr:anaerobic ribonucleoside-triphosphate reductase activating protein [Candidatus Lokiarchaeota archaeon]
MRVGGIIDISTKDIPNKSTMVIFTVGCNLSCGFCHNKYLLHEGVGRDIDVPKLMEQIKSNMLVSGVSISGGEPTLQNDLLELCEEIKNIGKYISIDTNGTNPEIITKLLPFINRVALDIKAPLNNKKLAKITGNQVDSDLISESFIIINNREDIDFEIRTTYVENLMKPNDIDKIISYLRKNMFRGNFVLQQYQYSEGVGEEHKQKFQKPEHITLLNILKPYKNMNLPFQIYLRDDVVGYSRIDQIYDYLDA